ncbi:AI-2E family transporter [Camelimonas lactis]|uniref:Putative PurR-regulated permease PerM n=1 Tax=Camelimonas lactis TaxID=659006 RepID=A0A4R2GJR4_9HYPH|nr:AI-2E family transporter [Camelimonas lactis]TCO09018.1 putative PurR-regulated permease PerM [Camelimonas lactis]
MAPVRDTARPSAPPVLSPPRTTPDIARPSAAALLTLVVLAGLLYVGRDIFMPLAVAILLTFTLAPIVNFLRKWSVPRIPAVIFTVTVAFAIIGLFSFIVASQITSLAGNIPTYQANIVQKVQALKEMGAGGGIIDRINRAVARIGAEIEKTAPSAPQRESAAPEAAAPASEAAPAEQKPLPVEIVTREGPVEILRNVVMPLVSPFATAGLIIVVVIFMLLEREDLRDRFIRLAGAGDLYRTTEALQDAGARVGHYLLMQLVVNTLYAIPIALGLWLLGIPNAMLWGLLTLALRFVPYIGPVIGMMIPLFLALAVSPGWTLLLWTAALFIVVELISNNIIEPWLYGSRTGLSPMAIIVAAIVWTSLWGPVGLVLSTPITVCLMVLGRHVPQFAFLDVLLGNTPVLEPHQRLYQRLLAGDPHEATDNAEDYLETGYLVDYYGDIGLPALRIGETDRQRGVLDEAQRARFAATAQALVANLTDIALEEEAEEENHREGADNAEGQGAAGPVARLQRGVLARLRPGREAEAEADAHDAAQPAATEAPALVLPDGEGRRLLLIGGRSELDDVAAAMLAQTLQAQGAETSLAPFSDIAGFGRLTLPLDGVDTAVVAYLNVASAAHARQTVRRLKRAQPALRVGVFVPLDEADPPLPFDAPAIYADFIATRLRDAVRLALADAEPDADVNRRLFTRHVARPLRAPRQPAAAVKG